MSLELLLCVSLQWKITRFKAHFDEKNSSMVTIMYSCVSCSQCELEAEAKSGSKIFQVF